MAECSYSTSTQSRDPIDQSGIRLCKTSPKFLESNATSHTWVFSAVAELIDNAYDPDVRATQIHINEQQINGHTCFVFTDDGNGLDEEKLYRMLSFGYSDKPETLEYKPIGRYGNGFKSGSMRLGKDAIVLTKHHGTLSVGLLSQTYHERIQADTVRIPIVTFDRQTLQLVEPVGQNQANLNAILSYSIFTSDDELMDQLTSLPDFDPSEPCGTKIIIWNLRELSQGRLELCFRRDIKDIVYNDPDFYSGPAATDGLDTLDYEHSLRKYCSILYLRPRMKIFILGKKVRSRLVAKDLCKSELDTYTMKGQAPLSITFGFNPARARTDNSTDYGIVLYHKNRLIKAYEKVGYQKQANSGQGIGVVGVVEADFLTPSHNKQNFNVDEKYHRVMNALARKLNEYWDTKMAASSHEGAAPKIEVDLEPDCSWVQCDHCLKWRRLPDGSPTIPEDAAWYCSMHPNEVIAALACSAAEDKLDQGEVDLYVQTTYRREKNEAAKRRKSNFTARHRSSPGMAQTEDNASSKRRRTDDDEPMNGEAHQLNGTPRKSSLVNEIRKKIEALNRKTQRLLVDRPAAIGDIADALHRDLERNRDDDESRTVLCVRCHSWKKLPVGYRVDDTNAWECSMHPDERQRTCQADHDYCSDQSPITDEGPSPAASVDNHRDANGIAAKEDKPAPAVSMLEVQGTPPVLTVDSDSGGENQDDDADIRALQKEVDKLASIVDAIERDRQRASLEKVQTCDAECQYEDPNPKTTVDAETQMDENGCTGCEAERKYEDTKRRIALLLNILLEQEVRIEPENALETMEILINNDTGMKRE